MKKKKKHHQKTKNSQQFRVHRHSNKKSSCCLLHIVGTPSVAFTDLFKVRSLECIAVPQKVKWEKFHCKFEGGRRAEEKEIQSSLVGCWLLMSWMEWAGTRSFADCFVFWVQLAHVWSKCWTISVSFCFSTQVSSYNRFFFFLNENQIQNNINSSALIPPSSTVPVLLLPTVVGRLRATLRVRCWGVVRRAAVSIHTHP